MMKLAYRVYIVTLILLAFVFAVSAQDTPKNARSAKDDRNTAPTVGTGGPVGGPTGLFTVYDGQTLRRGEYTFSAAYSNYDRDPGNVDITEVPLNFQIGLTNRIELFFNTDGYRAVKVNSPRNLSSNYLPNSRVFIGGSFQSGPAIILAPSGPGAGSLEGQAIFRYTGSQNFVQYPYTGGQAGQFGGFPFGFVGNALLGPPQTGGNGADSFPGVGSVYGSILPGVVLQTTCAAANVASCANVATIPTVFALAPSYLPDAPFVNRSFGESAFNSFTGGVKWRFNGIDKPVGYGVVAWYKWYADNADDFSGFNQLQRGASPGGNRGDIGVTFFADARLRRWANLSGNIGYVYTSNPKSGGFTLLDRGDELQAAVGVDFPINKWFQPIFEFRSLQYVGGRTPNAFENNPMDAIAGIRVFPTRWLGFGFAYRYHANEQDEESFNEDDTFSSSVVIPCGPNITGCVPRTVTSTWSGVPPGFQLSEDPHGYIVQAFIGRRNKRAAEQVNVPANVTALNLSDTEIRGGCQPGYAPNEGESCNESSINVTTTATDVENDVLTYNYTVSGGRIVGTGAAVTWDLSGAAPGTYTITAGVDDGCGLCGKTETKTITIAECACHKVCECPAISVSGPSGLTAVGQPMTFTANVSGGSYTPSTYNWTVSAGTISTGQGTPSITVDTAGLAGGSNVTATVDLGPNDCSCTSTASETGSLEAKPIPVLVDEFGKQPDDVIRGRLDTFFTELQNNPDNQGYIINYGTDAQIAKREKLIRNHIAFRKFDASRITLVRGGASTDGEAHTKLYRVPPGADNPNP
ncbi:MAG TPA: hypothetical protein VGQ55_09950 [Pyrinomonadaceae bacterium]|jgi:hypothetical protein|nr:hypothetical protein [Pyrinomonadaceae bacterium]